MHTYISNLIYLLKFISGLIFLFNEVKEKNNFHHIDMKYIVINIDKKIIVMKEANITFLAISLHLLSFSIYFFLHLYIDLSILFYVDVVCVRVYMYKMRFD